MALFRAHNFCVRQLISPKAQTLKLALRDFNHCVDGCRAKATTSWQWIVSGGIVITGKFCLDLKTAKCETKTVQIETTTEDRKTAFPWWQFITEYLWPHIVALTIAIISAFAVAILNTKIGHGIGALVNVVSANLGQGSSSSETFIQQIKEPAWNIIKLYSSHALMTFSYIYSLAVVGNA